MVTITEILVITTIFSWFRCRTRQNDSKARPASLRVPRSNMTLRAPYIWSPQPLELQKPRPSADVPSGELEDGYRSDSAHAHSEHNYGGGGGGGAGGAAPPGWRPNPATQRRPSAHPARRDD